MDEQIVERIAKVAHEANRAYGETIKEYLPPWEMAPPYIRTSVLKGVRFHLDTPDATPAASHESWLKEKAETGWVYGEVKDGDAKPPTHPCIKPFNELPASQKMKDYIFHSIVHGMKKGLDEP